MISAMLTVISSLPFVGICVAFSVLALLFFFFKKKNQKGIIYASFDELTPFALRARRLTAALVALCILGILLLGVVLANRSRLEIQPRSAVVPDPNRNATVIVIDISGSMILTGTGDQYNAGDKYSLAHSAFLRVLGGNPDDYMGLVFFASFAFAPIPLTDDRSAFESFASPGFFQSPLVKQISGGTDGSSGIHAAEQLLARSNSLHKRIIFISDLDDNDETKLMFNLKQAQKSGIDITLIGIETSQGVQSQLNSNGLEVTEVTTEADAARIGPMETSFPYKEDLAFVTKLDSWQLVFAFCALAAFVIMIVLQVYVRRPSIMRSKE